MNDDELRNRLARLDPQATAPVDPITSPRAQDLLERIMTTTDLLNESPVEPSPKRRWLPVAAAASVAAAGIVAAVVMSNDSPAAPAKKTTLALTAPAATAPGRPGLSTNSCIRFDVDILKQEPVAFAGTVTAVEPGSVTLDVTKWFKGGTADQVTIGVRDSSNSSIALDGVEFVKGKDFLVSADRGTVATCGYSGPEDPTLRQAFEDAFGG